MAQKDYVRRARSGARRKNTNRKKRRSRNISKTMVVLAVALLVVFIGGLYFIVNNKPDELPLLPNNNPRTGTGLPPKPEERWRYIKELENRQIGVSTPTEPSAGSQTNANTQLTNEQRQLLEQIQSDMRQLPTQLSEVPYNDLSPTPRSSVIVKPPVNEAPSSQPRPTQKMLEPAPQIPQTRTQPAPPEKVQRWMLQCGSFRSAEQAESIRAQLAFAGIESRVTSSGDWKRVVLGPYNNRAIADKMLQRLKGNGVSGCIPLASGG